LIALTPIEFSEFNLNSRIRLLKKDGELIQFKKVNERYKMLLYSVYGFYVQCIFDLGEAKMTQAQIVISSNWLDFHNAS
jgi:hypothetical protein